MVWTKKDTVAIIPYYGGDGGYRRGSKPNNRLDYLKRTLESLKGKATRVVFTCNDPDFESACKLECEQIEGLPTEDPRLLIHDTCKEVQESYDSFKYVLYTDADHEFTIKPEYFRGMTHGQYFVPHRLEEVVDGKGANRGMPYGKYVITNFSPEGRVTNKDQGYSGAYFVTKEDFNKINFTKNQCDMIGEQAAGFNVFESNLCCFKLDVEEFNVIHLSGKDYHESL